jgi:hypothetical protein
MRRATLGALALIALTGCAGTDSPPRDEGDAPRGSNADVPAAPKRPKPEPTEPEDTGPARFGQSYTYTDGITVRVTKPKPYTPSEYAAVGRGAPIMFDVILVNETRKPFDPSLALVSVQSGNREAEEIFDSEKGLDGTPQTKVLPGREARYTVGFSVKNPDDLVVQVAPSFEHEESLWATR